MRRLLLLIGLTVLALGTLAPALEALAPCPVHCVDEGPGSGSDCAADQCCSCCVHPRLVTPDPLRQGAPRSPTARVSTIHATVATSADPREILHIPKPTLG